VTVAVERDPEGRTSLLLVAPLRIEARAVSVGGPGTRVARCGAGPVRAANTARTLAASPSGSAGLADTATAATAVAVTGVAGGLVAGLTPGTVIVADRVLDEQGHQIGPDLTSAPLLAAGLRRHGLDARVGPVVSTDHLVKTTDERDRLAALGALAVDMESAAVVAQDWHRPLAVVRAVADTRDREVRSPATISGGLRALRSLRASVPVLEQWAAAASPRTVLLAGPRSFCAGVERAIETVVRALDRFGAPVYVRRQIVHNHHVVTDLEGRGAVFVHELDEVPDGATVVYSAHGVGRAVREAAKAKHLHVVDATCPLVAKVHHEVRRFRDRGFEVVMVGHAGHDETEGTLDEIDGITLIETEEDVIDLVVDDPDHLAYVTQTTLSGDDVASVLGPLTDRFPAVVGPHAADICYATQNRQDAVRAMASECDLVLVIGSANSSNSARLVEVASRSGSRAELIEDESALHLDWLRGAATIGLTAGASAPPALIERVTASLAGLGSLSIEERTLRAEHVNFPLPMEVR
jgi:4-hydroxy-3-methylbut-2-enyl diphosphate reductase